MGAWSDSAQSLPNPSNKLGPHKLQDVTRPMPHEKHFNLSLCLSFRAFVAWEDGVFADVEAEHKERQLLAEYKEKLIIDDQVIPDPSTLKKGWLREDDNGLMKWPSIYFLDIAGYLKTRTSADLMKLLVNEYKEGKVFRYFSCGWVKGVFYHPIAPSSEFCLLKCKVTPSQRLSSKPYDVWAIVVKDSNDNLGGTMKNCYCTCTAGLYGACNHVAGLLFRVESAVMSGITKPSCTDRLAKWNVPSTKTQVSPGPVSSVVFKKDHCRTLASINRTRQAKMLKGD